MIHKKTGPYEFKNDSTEVPVLTNFTRKKLSLVKTHLFYNKDNIVSLSEMVIDYYCSCIVPRTLIFCDNDG